MRSNKPVIVFVGDDDRATDFMEATDTYVLGAPTLRIALAQTIFSYPDAIVIDAQPANMPMAEEVFSHLQTIAHPPLVLLSDEPGRWDTRTINTVTILPNDATHEALAEAVYQMVNGHIEAAS
jgi:hypothetical protein